MMILRVFISTRGLCLTLFKLNYKDLHEPEYLQSLCVYIVNNLTNKLAIDLLIKFEKINEKIYVKNMNEILDVLIHLMIMDHEVCVSRNKCVGLE